MSIPAASTPTARRHLLIVDDDRDPVRAPVRLLKPTKGLTVIVAHMEGLHLDEHMAASGSDRRRRSRRAARRLRRGLDTARARHSVRDRGFIEEQRRARAAAAGAREIATEPHDVRALATRLLK